MNKLGLWFYVRLIFYKLFFEVRYIITWTDKNGNECELSFKRLGYSKEFCKLLNERYGYKPVITLYKY